MYHVLKKTRHTYGPRAVLVGIFLAALIAGLAIIRLIYEQPSTADAHLLFNGKVIATMDPRIAASVIEGMPVWVTVEGFDREKFAGHVQMIEQENDKETLLLIKIQHPPEDIHPPVHCVVTVDTTSRPLR